MAKPRRSERPSRGPPTHSPDYSERPPPRPPHPHKKPSRTRHSRAARPPVEERPPERKRPAKAKMMTRMGIDMHVLANIDDNPNVSVDNLSMELGIERQEVMASIRRLRTDRARFIEVQKRVEAKRFKNYLDNNSGSSVEAEEDIPEY